MPGITSSSGSPQIYTKTGTGGLVLGIIETNNTVC